MIFEPFDYMAWAKQHQGRYQHDLSVSGMAPPTAEWFTPDPTCLSLSGLSATLRAEMKQAIAQTYGVSENQVVLAGGTSEANFLVYGALLSAGDAVLVEQPNYQAMARLASVFGAHTLPFARRLHNQCAFDLDALRHAWRSEVKLVALTTPHNPSGFAMTQGDLLALGAWLDEVDAYAVIDEVYRDFMPTPLPVAQALHPRLITTASLTKVYGLGALRAGWALLPQLLARKAEQLYDYMAVNQSTTMVQLALNAWPQLPRLRQRAQDRAKENGGLVRAWLAQSQYFKGQVPNIGIVSMLQLPPGADDLALSRNLAEQHQVLITPGSFFDAPGWVRIAYGMDSARLRAALGALESSVRAL